MSNMWDQQPPQQPDSNQPNQPINKNAPSRTGSLLHDYRQQQPYTPQQPFPQSPPQPQQPPQPMASPQPPQYSPTPGQSQGGYNPYSPMPQGSVARAGQRPQNPPIPQGPQPPQQWSQGPQGPQQGPNPYGNPWQTVKQWTGKMMAMNRAGYPAPPMGPQSPQVGPQGPQNPQGPQQGFNPYGNPWQTVKQWTGKMAAAHRAAYEPPPPAMQVYRPPMNNNSQQLRQPPSQFLPGQGGPLPQHSRPLRIIQRRQRRQDPKRKRVGLIVLITVISLLVILLGSSGAYAYTYYQSQLPTMQKLANQQIPQTSRIYDRNGVLLYNAYSAGGRRTYVEYKYIPSVMDYAMTSAEDPTFWQNNGVDPNGITRAAYQYVSTHHVESGGSTITQQLIKNLRNDTTDTIQRKISEATLAIGLTQQYPKWKILEMYLNVSPFGAQDLGVEAAAEEYFNLQPVCNTNFDQGVFNCVPGIALLDCPQLSSCNNSSQVKMVNGNVVKTYKSDPMVALARASLLAAIPQSPVSYDPTLGKYNRGLALSRQDYVLHQMMRYGEAVQGIGKITPAIITQAEALTTKMTFTSFKQSTLSPQFVNWVIPQIEDALGNGNEQLGVEMFITGGFNIRTTIDAKVEQYVEAAVTRHLTQPELQYFPYHYATLSTDYNINDAAVVVMSAKTGEIIALDGSSNYYSTNPEIDGQYDVATDGLGRQPGSSFKIFDYVTAFEMGWYPGIVLPDMKTYFPNGGGSSIANAYTPPDYSAYGIAGTNVTARVATADSLNVPAVRSVEFAGVNNVINTARRFGVTGIDNELAVVNQQRAAKKESPLTLDQLYGPSLALGTAQIPLIQMVGAYQVLANQGMRIPPHSVLDIWDNYGHHLYHYDPTHPNGTQVVSPQIAYLMTNILADENARAVEFWPDHALSFWDMDPTHTTWQVAAKTGTTSNSANNAIIDNLTFGYTPDVVVGVWVGNANNDAMTNDPLGITGAAPIWHSIIENMVGQCNYDYTTSTAPDNIPCTDMQDVKALNFADKQFTVPTGIGQYSTNTYNGLMGTGNYDWMLTNEQPQQTGVAPVTTTCTPNNNNGIVTCLPGNSGGGNNGGGNNNGGNGNGTGTGGGNPPINGGPAQTPGGGKGNGGGNQSG